MEVYNNGQSSTPTYTPSVSQGRYTSHWADCLEIATIALLVTAVVLSAFVDPLFFLCVFTAAAVFLTLVYWDSCCCDDEDEPSIEQRTDYFARTALRSPEQLLDDATERAALESLRTSEAEAAQRKREKELQEDIERCIKYNGQAPSLNTNLN